MIFNTILSASAFVAAAHAHGVILNAQGISGSPASVGFQVDLSIPRNCTTISPCQQDTTIIRDAEITANIVNECGRTELTGNIDVGENTENALAAGAVTQVQSGSQLTVTIHQVNADGAGPYTCDVDMSSNAGITFTNLTVTNNIPGANGLSQAKEQDFNITVTMPDSLNCTGASTGDICTVRCRNNAVAGPFGGCFAVQQTDTTGKVNTVSNIDTAASLSGVEAQVLQNQADLDGALKANANAGTDTAVANVAAVENVLGITVTTKSSAVQTPEAALGANAAAATTGTTTAAASSSTASTTKTKKNKKTTTTASTATATDAAAAAATTTSSSKGNKNNNKRADTSADKSVPGHLRWGKRLAALIGDESI